MLDRRGSTGLATSAAVRLFDTASTKFPEECSFTQAPASRCTTGGENGVSRESVLGGTVNKSNTKSSAGRHAVHGHTVSGEVLWVSFAFGVLVHRMGSVKASSSPYIEAKG